ncbi:MAG: hydrogenase iron-sulfur subunit [Candidatus Hermodarchaeota archaeon]
MLIKIKKVRNNEFEPKILVFCCNWCSYAGADLAGVSRFQYPPNIRIIRVMCSSRVEPIFVLRAFNNGIDGVLIIGCHMGDCHYMKGFEYTQDRMDHLKKLIKCIGIEADRFQLHSISASEGKQFSELIKEFTERITGLGELKIPKKSGIIELESNYKTN